MASLYGRVAATADRWADEIARAIGPVQPGRPVHATATVTRTGLPEQLARAAAAQAVTQWATGHGRRLAPLAAAHWDHQAGTITIDIPADI